MRELIGDLRFGFGAFSPALFPYARFIAALCLGALGGFVFSQLRLPLPWMLGSLAACTLGALLKAPIEAPGVVRPPVMAVIGVLLGSGFSPALVAQVPGWLPTMLGLALFVLVSGAACVTYFRRVGRFDPVTAYFAGMPGGLAEMVTLGDAKGGDARVIALIHSTRVLLIVFTLPFIVQAILGTPLAAGARPFVSVLDGPWLADLWLVATAVVGVVLGYVLHLPSPSLIGPMLASAAVHAAGLTDFAPPTDVVNAAQVVLGTSLGCRFRGVEPRELMRLLTLSLGSTAILLAITLVFGGVVSRVAAYDFVAVLLAYSPGGLTEMSLVALALQVEVAFVAAHHILRILFVMLGAAPVFAWLGRRGRGRP